MEMTIEEIEELQKWLAEEHKKAVLKMLLNKMKASSKE